MDPEAVNIKLLTHPQKALHKLYWYIACVLSQFAAPGLNSAANWHRACNIPSAACAVPAEDKQVVLEKYRGP
jgi:hypothetical protein